MSITYLKTGEKEDIDYCCPNCVYEMKLKIQIEADHPADEDDEDASKLGQRELSACAGRDLAAGSPWQSTVSASFTSSTIGSPDEKGLVGWGNIFGVLQESLDCFYIDRALQGIGLVEQFCKSPSSYFHFDVHFQPNPPKKFHLLSASSTSESWATWECHAPVEPKLQQRWQQCMGSLVMRLVMFMVVMVMLRSRHATTTSYLLAGQCHILCYPRDPQAASVHSSAPHGTFRSHQHWTVDLKKKENVN